MKRLVKGVITATLMFVVINVANAQQCHRNGYRQGTAKEQGFGVERGLNLTEDQQAQMKSLRLKLQQEMLPIRNKLGENRARFRTLSTVEDADMKSINKLIDANSQLDASMVKLQAANQQAVRKLLTDEQRIIFDSREFHRGERRSERQPGQRGEIRQKGTKRSGEGSSK